ncbi:hypothetical protein F4818DRAFT_433809 [Hypoxylon cercidicola]|nr:hypothetical protein F4818DRAFT_433809 [Hypoxylon cercidicola]
MQIIKRETMFITDLANNRIFFFEHPDHYDVPDSVNTLRETLLDFFCTVIDRLGIYQEDAFEQPNYLLSILQTFDDSERTRIAQTIYRHGTTKNWAVTLHRGQDREPEWVSFFYECFFKPLASILNRTDSRSAARQKFYYDHFEYAHNRPWSLFSSSFRHAHQQTTSLTQPTPDLAAYFPVFDIQTDGSQWPWVRGPKNIIVENFSRATLERLDKHGLHPSTTGSFDEGRQEGIDPSNSICYPWLIVEHKKAEQQSGTECYCLAANDAAAVLMTLRTLAKYSADNIVPPVVTMTTMGKVVRIWIAFFDTEQEIYKMICIWKGFMTTIVDIVKLEAILENLHTWATRVLRPWISHCIDQWKLHHPADPTPNPYNIGKDSGDISSVNIETKAPDPEQATATNEVEGDGHSNDLLTSQPTHMLRMEPFAESRPRADSDPFPRPNAEFITNQTDITSVMKDATDASNTGQEAHDVHTERKILRSETTGRHIRVRLPSAPVDQGPPSDHSFLWEAANMPPVDSSRSSSPAVEDIVPVSSPLAFSYSNNGPSTPPRTPPMGTSTLLAEKAALAWKGFRGTPFLDTATSEPIKSAITRNPDSGDSAREQVIDDVDTGELNTDLSVVGNSNTPPQTSAFGEWELESPCSNHFDDREADWLDDEPDTSSKHELVDDPNISRPNPNPNYFSVLSEMPEIASSETSSDTEADPPDTKEAPSDTEDAPPDPASANPLDHDEPIDSADTFLFTGQEPPPVEHHEGRVCGPQEFKFELRSVPREQPASPEEEASDAGGGTGARATVAMLRAASLTPAVRGSVPARGSTNAYRRRPVNPIVLAYYRDTFRLFPRSAVSAEQLRNILVGFFSSGGKGEEKMFCYRVIGWPEEAKRG